MTNINGVEFDIDFTDADFVEKIEEGYKRVIEETNEYRKNKKNLEMTHAEGIRQECKIFKNFFDYVLGEGTSEKLFKYKNSINQCTKALEDIILAKENQIKEFETKISKYSPERLKR